MPCQLHAVAPPPRRQKLFKQEYQEIRSLNNILKFIEFENLLPRCKKNDVPTEVIWSHNISKANKVHVGTNPMLQQLLAYGCYRREIFNLQNVSLAPTTFSHARDGSHNTPHFEPCANLFCSTKPGRKGGVWNLGRNQQVEAY